MFQFWPLHGDLSCVSCFSLAQSLWWVRQWRGQRKEFLTSCDTSLQNRGQTSFLSFLGLIDCCALRARDKRCRGSVSVVLLRCGSGYTWQPWGSYFNSSVHGFSFSCRSWEGPSENRACGFGICWQCVVDVSLGTQKTTTWAKGLFHFTGDRKETQ